MFGKTTDEEGVSLVSTNTPIITGLHVKGNKLIELKMGVNQDGSPTERWATLTIEQSNGAKLTHTLWNPNDDADAIKVVNAFILHLCTSFITVAEYEQLVGTPTSFAHFINTVGTTIIPKAKDLTFTMTVIYRPNKGKYYAQLPKYIPFIEKDGTSPSTLYMKKSYIFEIPETTDMDATTSATVSGGDLF